MLDQQPFRHQSNVDAKNSRQPLVRCLLPKYIDYTATRDAAHRTLPLGWSCFFNRQFRQCINPKEENPDNDTTAQLNELAENVATRLANLPEFDETATRWRAMEGPGATPPAPIAGWRPEPAAPFPNHRHQERTMSLQPCGSWLPLRGQRVEIRQSGRVVDAGTVDAVTRDDDVLWLGPDGVNKHRRIIERDPQREVWAEA